MAVPDLKLAFDMDGRTHVFAARDFTGADDLDLYRETGFTVLEVFGGKITLFTLAGLCWLERRRTEPGLTYADVNKSMTFDVVDTVREAEQTERSADPEAPGGN